ncbi:MAG: hypothetical protein JW996_03680 [Candidatus Cloacimonetes bacterium]|nr:hypothetical protein [Candidatus Cloacimonadota bacterium]
MKKNILILVVILLFISRLHSLKSDFLFTIGTAFIVSSREGYNPAISASFGLDVWVHNRISIGFQPEGSYSKIYAATIVDSCKYEEKWDVSFPLTVKYFISTQGAIEFYSTGSYGFLIAAKQGKKLKKNLSINFINTLIWGFGFKYKKAFLELTCTYPYNDPGDFFQVNIRAGFALPLNYKKQY